MIDFMEKSGLLYPICNTYLISFQILQLSKGPDIGIDLLRVHKFKSKIGAT